MSDLETYLATITEPMRRAKARDALQRQMRLNGAAMWRWQAIETLLSDGVDHIDRDKGRVYMNRGTFFDISSLTSTAVDYLQWRLT